MFSRRPDVMELRGKIIGRMCEAPWSREPWMRAWALTVGLGGDFSTLVGDLNAHVFHVEHLETHLFQVESST